MSIERDSRSKSSLISLCNVASDYSIKRPSLRTSKARNVRGKGRSLAAMKACPYWVGGMMRGNGLALVVILNWRHLESLLFGD